MRFIVCARNRSTGDTFVVGQRAYPDKDGAISALGGSSSLDGLADCELFVLDLDEATPVVLVHARQEPVLEGFAAPPRSLDAEPLIEQCPSDASPEAPTDEEIGERLEESDLWSIVETITDEPLDASSADADAPSAPWWIDAAPSEDIVQVSIYDCADDLGGEPVAEQTAVSAAEPRSEGRDGYDGDSVGAHESALAAADLQEAAADSAARSEAALELSRDETPAAEQDFAGDVQFDETMDDARLAAEPLPDVIETPESDPGVMRVDFDAWTCVDCVFTTTCERTGDESPSDCGSFQWRPA